MNVLYLVAARSSLLLDVVRDQFDAGVFLSKVDGSVLLTVILVNVAPAPTADMEFCSSRALALEWLGMHVFR